MPTEWVATYDNSMSCQNCTQTYTRTFDITTGPYATFTQYDNSMFSNGSGGAARANKAIGAAKNLAVDVVQTAQADTANLGSGAVVYTIGLGAIDAELLNRMANDIDAPTYNANLPEGEFIASPTVNDLKAAFQKVRGHVIRLTR